MTKSRAMWWTLAGLAVFLGGGVLAALMGVSTVKISDVYFMSGLVVIAVGAVMQLSHAHLFAGFRRSRRQKTYKENDEPEKAMDVSDITDKKNAPVRFSSWNTWLWIAGAVLIVAAVVITI